MKKTILTFILISIAALASAQTWDQIKKDHNTYLSGEGWGETIDEADQQALSDLISKLSVVVSSNMEVLEGEKRNNSSVDYQKYVESKVKTYSNATLTNTESIILGNEPDAHVGRWIKREELEKIFQGRRAKVREYVVNAEKAEAKGKIDDALRDYYWAYILMTTLQRPSDIIHTTPDGEEHVLVTYVPEKINEIFESINATVISRDGDDLELYFTYEDNPIVSLDYTYFDGGRWSNLYSAKNGKGVLELAPGALGENIQLKVEYAYKNESHIDREISSVINVVNSSSFRKSYITIKGNPDTQKAKQVMTTETEEVAKASAALAKLDDETHIRNSVSKVINAIETRQYNSANDIFTAEGLDMYTRLISYGNAKVIGTPVYNVYKSADRTIVRSIPMSFSFSHGMKKSFVEDVVFAFNQEGLIESLAFGLDHIATQDILTKQAWPEHSRVAIIEFLENYKTAFALERLDYIRSIFDDNAVIIVGRLVKPATGANAENNMSTNNKVIERTRLTKEQYLKNLERCFQSNEYVNIRFANNDVIKAGKGGEIYGIQIKQDYYSTNYGDTGYLFLLVNLNDVKAPMITVRTWQPEPDPLDGSVIGLNDF